MQIEEIAQGLTLHRLTFDYPGLALRLIELFGNTETALKGLADPNFRAPPALRKRLQSRNSRRFRDEVDRDLGWGDRTDQHVIFLHDPQYPYLLRQVADPPFCLFLRGDRQLIEGDQLAMVGSRKPTSMGVSIAKEFAAGLTAAGLLITSGLAFGIDAAAHSGCLEAGGRTIAVLGCGIDRTYPRYHVGLTEQILTNNGLLVSEYPIGISARPHYFPQRNRIVTGMSLGTLIVEAAQRSGSLISARLAMEQGREVFAIPGSIRNPQSRGCHYLIGQGAKLATSVEDILEELDIKSGLSESQGSAREPRAKVSLSDSEQRILDSLGGETMPADGIQELTGIEISAVLVLLVKLEMAGLINSDASGFRRS